MRAYEHFLTMSYKGYCISNGETLASYKNPTSEANAKNPGIKMTIEKDSDVEEFVSRCNVYFQSDDESGKVHGNFIECWRDVLLGRETSWKLANVRFRNYEMRLYYINEKLYDEYGEIWGYHDDPGEDEFSDGDLLPPYYAWVDFCVDEEKNSPKMKLRFETVSSLNGKNDVTHVCISADGSIIATEVDDNWERQYIFQNESASNIETPVRVIECSW